MWLRANPKSLHKRWLLLTLVLFGACQTTVPPQTTPQTPVFHPHNFHGGDIYRIMPASKFLIFVYRGGSLAALGHNHIISSRALNGRVYKHPQLERSGVDCRFSLHQLVVDDPVDRRAYGADFASQPSAKDITATRRNMLGPAVLDAAQYPEVRIQSTGLLVKPAGIDLSVRIHLHGVSHDLTLPVKLEQQGDKLLASGETEILQRDFGITPFSILLGAIAVQEHVGIRFRIIAIKETSRAN